MSSKNIKEKVVAQIRQEKEKREIENTKSQSEKTTEMETYKGIMIEKWSPIEDLLKEIASEITLKSYNYELTFKNYSAEIKFKLGPAIHIKGTSYGEKAYEEHRYSFDHNIGRYICTKTYQSSATDQTISGLKYLFYSFFGDPKPKIVKKYFHSADELVEHYGGMIIKINRSFD